MKSKGEEEKKSKGSCKGFRVKRKRINNQNNKIYNVADNIKGMLISTDIMTLRIINSCF